MRDSPSMTRRRSVAGPRTWLGPWTATLVGLVALAAVLGVPSGGRADVSRYDVQAETVRDLKTGLTWQRVLATDAKLSFAAASASCADLVLQDHDDWRLPSLQEFETIVDEGRSNPAIDPVLFPGTPAEGFWSGTPWSGTPMLAWHVDFDRGSAAYDTATMLYRVRCVRWEP
jgi:Protein of unknown function (DUF1566)